MAHSAMAVAMVIIDRIRKGYKSLSALMRIVWLNVGVFVALRLLAIAGVFGGDVTFIDRVLPWVELSSSWSVLLTRPWTLLTYMFSQYDLMHIVFNMLWLYWFGTIFMMAGNARQLTVVYLYGGVAGGLLYMAGFTVLPFFAGSQGFLIGSSASVIAVVTAVAILLPRFKMHLLFFGSVSVKWIAIATIVLVLIGVTGSNAGGEVAHLGGVLAGTAYALLLRRGHDITAPLSVLNRRPSSTPTADFIREPAHEPGGLTGEESRDLDRILDKIKKSGYSALTPAERDRLFSVSRKIK